MAREAMLWERKGEGTGEGAGKLQCHLCAHHCLIAPGRRGICGVRENAAGVLVSLVYGLVVAEHVDPMEKKPLYHFLPGSASYSIATAGCNLSCSHCQNWEISLAAPKKDPIPGRARKPGEIVEAASASGCLSISYTYTEPTVFMEFALDCALLAREQGMANVFVTNGFMSPQARDAAVPLLDAANVDLKGATEEHYRKICGARLAPVKETIADLRKRGVWVEVTTLLIPHLNDDEESLSEIASFIASVDPLMPWHVSRFFPTYKMTDRPPTPVASLEKALEIGKRAGLRYIYPGNIPRLGDATSCHVCGTVLLRRIGFSVTDNDINKEGNCPGCGTAFHGVLAPPVPGR